MKEIISSLSYKEWCQEHVDAGYAVLKTISTFKCITKKKKAEWINAANLTIKKYSEDIGD